MINLTVTIHYNVKHECKIYYVFVLYSILYQEKIEKRCF